MPAMGYAATCYGRHARIRTAHWRSCRGTAVQHGRALPSLLFYRCFSSNCMNPPTIELACPSRATALPVVVLVLALLCDGARCFVAPAISARTAVPGRIPISTRIMSSTSTENESRNPPPSLPTNVKGILFDMDGTLTDSDTLHFEAYRETFLKITPSFNGGDPITREYYDDWMSGNSNTAIVEKLFPEMPADDQTALWKSKEELYRLISTKMTPLPGLLDFLDRCRSKGLAMIIVTNAPRLDAVHTLKVLGLFDRFGKTMVIGYECARSKPHPDPYMEGLSRLGLSAAECVAFEDSVNGVSSAVSAGLYTFGVGESSQEKLKGVIGGGICVSDYLDSRLSQALGLTPTKKE